MIDLVTRASQGDIVAFERLAIQISPRLDTIARMTLFDRQLAEDAVQDGLLRIWQQLPALRDPSKFDAWANRLIINACYDIGRTRRRAGAVLDISTQMAVMPDESTKVADRDEIAAGMRRLKRDQRAILALRFYLQLEPAEIAETMGIPQGTARSRLHYALEALRSALAAEGRPSARWDS